MNANNTSISRRSFLMLAAGVAGLNLDRRVARCAGKTEPRVQAVTGEVAPDSLGTVLCHEHVMADFIGAKKVDKSRYDSDEVFESVVPHLRQVKNLGCDTLVECTPQYIGRDPLLLRRLSEATGLNILTNTGLYGAAGDKFLPDYAFGESAEQLANRWIAEWRDGIAGTAVKPGFIKIGVDPKPSEVDMKLLRAAALTHLETGLTIASHTGPGEAARPQIEALKKSGVCPSAFIWVHANSEPDSKEHVWAARKGAWVEFDGLSPDTVDEHVRLVLGVDDAGLLDNVLVSHDAGWYAVGEPGGGTFRPFDTLFTHFLPALRQAGFDEAKIRRLTQTNPQKAFARCVRRLV